MTNFSSRGAPVIALNLSVWLLARLSTRGTFELFTKQVGNSQVPSVAISQERSETISREVPPVSFLPLDVAKILDVETKQTARLEVLTQSSRRSKHRLPQDILGNLAMFLLLSVPNVRSDDKIVERENNVLQ